MKLSTTTFLVAAAYSAVGQASAKEERLSYDPKAEQCSEKPDILLNGEITKKNKIKGRPGEKIKIADGVEGLYDDKCDFWELSEPPQAQAMTSGGVPGANNPNNPASFCGRPMGDTGPFDPYYLTPGAPVAYKMSSSSPPPITYMEVAFPGITVVTVNGVTGVLDSHCNMPEPSASGDPHFKTWGGESFDFHGGCDLVLLKNDNFADGRGLNVNIRTHIKTWWSYIEAAVLEIGGDTMEVSGAEGGWIWFNGEQDEGYRIETQEFALGDYSIHSRRVNDHQTTNRIDLGDDNAISIETFKHFVRVNIKPKTQASFHGSTGLLGAFPQGTKVARDGKTVIEDANEFGQEWMVDPTSEPMLFHSVNASEDPHKCTMPDQTQKKVARRLGELGITEEDAALACARVTDSRDRDLCIFDVMATNDKDIAGSY